MIANYEQAGLICLGMSNQQLAQTSGTPIKEHRAGTWSLGRWFRLEGRLRRPC
jgi:hypothetical protein